MIEIRCVYHDRAVVGEGVYWSQREQALFWVDIDGHRVCRFEPISARNQSIDVGQPVGAVVELEDGGLLVALKDGIYALDFASGSLRPWCDPLGGDASSRLNDGKAGPDGRLYVGGIGPEGTQRLFRVERDGSSFEAIERGVTCSNGLCWSEDGKTFYYIDSPERVVRAYDFDAASGSIENRRVVVDTRSEECVPDGMTIDGQGMLWVAFMDGWRVCRFDPSTGEELQRILLPVAKVTSCVFGGPRYNQLYISTASAGFGAADWEREPLAGGLFVCEPGARGLPGNRFRKE